LNIFQHKNGFPIQSVDKQPLNLYRAVRFST